MITVSKLRNSASLIFTVLQGEGRGPPENGVYWLLVKTFIFVKTLFGWFVWASIVSPAKKMVIFNSI